LSSGQVTPPSSHNPSFATTCFPSPHLGSLLHLTRIPDFTPRATFAKPQLGPTETRISALATPSPLLIRLAADAPDYNRLQELIEIIQFGAFLRVNVPPPGSSLPTRRHVSNHNSATLYAAEIRALLKAEIEAGTTFNIGPSLPREWRSGNSGTWVCPLGAVPKSSSTPSKPCVRMIFDASHGGQLSLNDRITTSTAPLGASPYLSAQAIASTLLAAGKDALYSLTDVKSAFNNISLHPSQLRFSVVFFDGDYHVQTRLGFGYTRFIYHPHTLLNGPGLTPLLALQIYLKRLSALLTTFRSSKNGPFSV
jgi:hypothetical protein